MIKCLKYLFVFFVGVLIQSGVAHKALGAESASSNVGQSTENCSIYEGCEECQKQHNCPPTPNGAISNNSLKDLENTTQKQSTSTQTTTTGNQ